MYWAGRSLSPRPLGEIVRKDVNSFPQASKPVRWREAGNFPTPRIIQDRVEFLSELCELRNSGEGLNQELTLNAPLCTGKLFSDTLPLCSRYRLGVNVLGWAVTFPSPLVGEGAVVHEPLGEGYECG